jgi:hypothetical protein
MNADRIKSIRRHGKAARGQRELVKHLEGVRLTLKQAVNAHCYDCTGFYADGKTDCSLPACPLHPFMFYNKNRAKKTTTKTSSSAHMEKMRASRQKESSLLL